MGRKFTPFEVVVHYIGLKNQQEIQNYIDDFYIKEIKDRLASSTLMPDEKAEVLARLASYHSAKD